mgnify:CR=1 FL=1
MELAGSNVLGYQLADGTTLVVRPSGTEPKIKVYVLPPAPTALTAKEKWSNTPPGPRPCGIGPIDLLSLAPPGKPAGFLFFQ